MQKNLDLTKSRWEEIQDSLSSLTGYSLFIYDPIQQKPCTRVTLENIFCHQVHEIGREPLCQAGFKKQVNLAIETQEICFSKCQANLNFFVIPVRLSNQSNYAMIGGKIYYSHEESLIFKEAATQWGIPFQKLLSSMKEIRYGTAETLHKTARHLQTIGTVLLENIYRRNQYQSKATYLTALFDVASEFKKDLTHSTLYTALLNTLGILFDLKSACVFNESPKQGLHKGIAVFGEKKTALYQSEVLLDLLLEKRGERKSCVFNDVALDLLRSKLPSDTAFCHLFPIFESHSAKTTLAILDTALTAEDVKMITSFCQQAGVSIENIALQNQLSEQRKIIQSLSDLTTSLDSSLYLEPLHETILEHATQLLRAEQGSIMVLDEYKEELSIKAMKGMSKSLFEALNIKPGEGIAGQVYQTGVPLLVQDLASDPRIRQQSKPRYKTPSFVSVPLKVKNRTIGVINLADKITGEVFLEEDLQLLQAVASYVSIAIERSELYEKTEELKKISITDSLTGLLNRRYFQERLTEEIERSRRHGIPVCLMMIDIDNFKNFNDTYGHPGGDDILKLLSQALRNYIRAIDVAARYGGEEFTIILPQTNKQDAGIIADRLCKEIGKKETLQKKFTDTGSLTVSIGLAAFPNDAESIEELIRNADRALYQAKLQGKNRVVIFSRETFL